MASRTLILGTAGHIDHGKTALVLALTGTDTDRLPQEKARGITIDIGFAELDLGGCRLGIVDVPGHERFIRNMLAGASGIDLAMLVVAADDSVMPQTREHLAILELLGVRHGLVVLTKCDVAKASWLDLVEEEVRDLVKGTFLEGAPIARTSAVTKSGIDELKTLLESSAARIERAPREEPFRLAIDRAFVQPGVGTIVTGTVHSGVLMAGARVAWLPSGEEVKARGLHSHDRAVESVARGQRAAVNLMGVHHKIVSRGHEIATPGFLRASRLLTVRLEVLPNSPWPIKHRARLRAHLGTQEVMVSLALLAGTSVAPGETAYAQLATAGPTTATAGQPFVLRTESPLVTVGGGHVLQPCARRIPRRDTRAQERLADLHAQADDTRAAAAVYFCGTGPWTPLDLARDAGLALNDVEPVLARLRAEGRLVELDVGSGRLLHLHREAADELAQRVEGVVEDLHRQAPLEKRIPRARVVGRMNWLGDDALVGAVVDFLIEKGSLIGDERTVASEKFAPKLTSAQKRLVEDVVAIYKRAGLTPPGLAELARDLATAEAQLRPILEYCAGGDLVHLGAGLYLHAGAEEELRRRVGEGLADSPGHTMSQIRDLLGTSRKYALPMCEYLDRIGFTRRQDDIRVLGKGERGQAVMSDERFDRSSLITA